MAERVLILGGAGFIGSSLAISLKQQHPSWKISCFDNLRRRGSELNLTRFKKSGIEFIHGDIRSSSDLEPGMFNIDTIIDCSAEPSVLAGFSSPQYVLQTNLLGTINVLELARQIDARLLFLSTSRVYPIETLKSINLIESPTRLTIAPEQTISGVSNLGIAEDFPLQSYRSLYGTTKLASEMLIEEYRQAYGIQAIVNRCGVITGPWQMGKVDQGVFVLWLAAHYFEKSLSYIGYGGTGKQVRDLLHIEDLLRLISYQLEHFSELGGDVLNVGGGADNSLSLLETTKLCEAITGKSIPIKSEVTARQGDIPIYITDSSKIISKTGWKPTMNPEQTLRDIYSWILEYEEFLQPILS
ncbi:3-beta hydroxysteroid dehydrogenase/isomerase [Trichormus variabilis ATCC 29413]|uniref:3-beta hydroxysteroid dehydrogenase/isomerase n=2 Tax=Anabaena variabilis TaxID=264691 RepID=Q3M7S7_TRIV2|nr:MULTISPECIES: NAD-dependent epimerase/dehydratase family protein [Nostocaceae]ABA22959.1 3-beta hydroxysteroid dehydrogenase/isomerase [Trichormus variabilis ATCC 29413]MBC1213827.1 NAD-dependent epimerase/dehydratase family protein [Trichormus variabilis ARAD]MBC1257455.1 NAD-dependent epimerase/dehydratase family protein [Trichormus variabilis V5]MBC1266450.1 NAD-dependent epimerase/dehydratase family protein [Trichormus variabilis FSR]MBC1302594.1 NAD-dependent epimerase/dehydratase fami